MLAFAIVALVVLMASPALAHVDLESSSPADGESVASVPDVIELRFTAETEPIGDGIMLADADGSPIETTIAQPEPNLILVTPIEPLPNGIFGVLWTVSAGDAHPRSGTFTFRIDVPIAQSPVLTRDAQDAPPKSTPDTGAPATATAEDLEPVFEIPAEGSVTGDWTGRIGRWAAMTGVLVGIGAFALAATSLIGTKREVEEAGYFVRRAGVLVVVGTVVELLGVSMVLAGSALGGLAPAALVDAGSGSFGIAVLLRLIGGAAMMRGMAIVATEAVAPIADAQRLPALSRDVAPAGGVAVLDPVTASPHRLDVHRELVALVGIGLVTASYLFDGHTVTATPTVLVRVAAATHVLAAGVWVGGVLLTAWTLAGRKRRDVPLDAAAMVIRFSRVAGLALVGVAIAGAALTAAILDAPSELFTTSWGRILLLKLAAVGVAAAIGAYNHFVTVPALHTDSADHEAGDRLRRLVRVEGAILLAIVVLTAILVGAAS